MMAGYSYMDFLKRVKLCFRAYHGKSGSYIYAERCGERGEIFVYFLIQNLVLSQFSA